MVTTTPAPPGECKLVLRFYRATLSRALYYYSNSSVCPSVCLWRLGIDWSSGISYRSLTMSQVCKVHAFICQSLYTFCSALNALSITQRASARLTPHPSREIWTTIQPARKATQLLSCREDFRTERTWLHYAYFVQRQLLVPFLFSILFIFDVAFCQLVFLH